MSGMARKTINKREALRLTDKLIRFAEQDGHASVVPAALQRVRAQLNLMPMADILKKLPGDTIAAKARALGVSRQAYYRWIEGSARPAGAVAEQIAQLTGLAVEVITGRAIKKTE